MYKTCYFYIISKQISAEIEHLIESDLDDIYNKNEQNSGEPPPLQNRNNIDNIPIKQRFKCHSCEGSGCASPAKCIDAIQCWKSRVRESTG